MSGITVTLDARGLTAGLSRLTQQVVPEAAALALNRTAEEMQTAVRQHVGQAFTLRTAKSQRLFRNAIKITRDDRARPDRLRAVVRVQGPETITGADPVAAMLLRHEEGGPHSRTADREPFFIPADALRPTPSTVIPRRLYPANLRLADRKTPEGVLHALRGSKRRIEGQRRTFFRMGTLGIFEREGKDDIQRLWFFTRRIRLKPRLRFYATAEGVARERLTINLAGFLDAALRRTGR